MQALTGAAARCCPYAPPRTTCARCIEGDAVSVAAVNGPASIVVSGDEDAVGEIARRAEERGYRTKRLRVSHAFHSRADGAPCSRSSARSPRPSSTTRRSMPVVSNLTGETAPDRLATADYWVPHVREAVRFADGLRFLRAKGVRRFAELGPSAALSGLVEEALDDATVIPMLRSGTPEPVALAVATARLHTDGAVLDWAAILPGVEPADLPVHAFARDRFWLTPEPARTAGDGVLAAVRRADAAELGRALDADDEQRHSLEVALPLLANWLERREEQGTVERWTYRGTWEPVTFDAPTLSGTWLVVVPDTPRDHVVAGVEAGLRAAGATVVTATLADADPSAVDGLTGILSLLALDERGHADEPSLPVGLAANTVLAQAAARMTKAVPLWLLTRGAISTGRSDAVRAVAQATTWGLGQVIALESPERWGGVLDLPEEWDDRAARALAGCLAADAEGQLAIRRSGVLARRLARFGRAADQDRAWPAGTVLVTGGSGALAANVARWLADHGAEHVLLASRRGEDAPGAADLAAELSVKGTAVTTAACDTADREALAALLASIPAEHPLTSVIHTAGVLDDGVLDSMSPDRLAKVLRPKVDTARHLDELTRDHDLSAFVLFSSLAATTGSAGQANYAAANAYLDALAYRRRAEGLPATAIAWGPWAGSGMAAVDVVADRLRRIGTPPMDPDLACAAMQAAVLGDHPAVVVADIDWARFVQPAAGSKARSFLGLLAGELPAADTAIAPTGTDALAGLSGPERESKLTDIVRAQAAAVLGHDGPEGIEASRSFRENGFDSLTAVEFRNRLNAATGLRLPATLVFDFPTPGELARHLDGLLSGERPALVTSAAPVAADEPIAIVGIGCRFPGADTPEDYWRLIADGVDAVGPFPHDRGWATAGGDYAREGAFLTGADRFDAAFFEISPREALAMDPQQRLLLQTAWEAVERAGIDPATLRGERVGVFVGTNGQDYPALLARAEDDLGGHAGTGNAASVVSGRIAYALGLNGPALTVDTACSASLVALHLAAESLRRGECTMALTGGATIMSTPAAFAEFARQGGLAADGRCKPFAAGADGTGWGEGVGVLAVERLSDARRLGHPVLAVVRGTAVNPDGASNGLTAPNGPAQQRVIADALGNAGLTPDDVDVVEAHGTGTSLGDPIEAQALLATYGRDRAEDRPLWIGSVKSNIGHTQAAAGVAGVIKMVLAMAAGVAPRSLHAEEPSPHVDWSEGAVRVLSADVPWPDRDGQGGARPCPRSASAAPTPTSSWRRRPSPRPRPMTWTALRIALRCGCCPAVPRTPCGSRPHACCPPSTARPPRTSRFSLATTRTGFHHRGALPGGDREELLTGLRALRDGEPGALTGTAAGDGRLAFVFPGQGAQRAGMGLELAAEYGVFADALDEIAGHLDPLLPRPLREILAEGDLNRTEFTQPALFAVEVALFRLLESWGLRPDYVAGHSIGEFAAAHVAGVLDLAGAARLVAARGRLMQELPAGGLMVSVAAPEDEVAPLLAGTDVHLAAVNGPRSVVLSGPEEEVRRIAGALAEAGCRTRELRVSHAFHSGLMEPMTAEFRRVLDSLTFGTPRIPVISDVTGRDATPEQLASPAYWVDHVRSTVRFADVIACLGGHGVTRVVEAGPGGALSAMVRECLPGAAAVPLLRGDGDEPRRVRAALARMHVNGITPDWSAVFAADGGRRVDLPTYPFQTERFWPRLRPERTDELRLCYQVEWAALPATETSGGRWLVLGPGGEDLAAGLTARGLDVTAAAPDDLGDVGEVAGVLYEPAALTEVPRALRALDEAGVDAPLWCVTRAAVSVARSDAPAEPDQAAIWGLGRVAALELGGRWGGLVDLPAAPDARAYERLAATLGGSEDQVAIRASGRFGRRIARAAQSGGAWTPRGTALITGGTGGLGAYVARWLARNGAGHLVLVSRSGPDAAGVAGLEAELTELGARVTVKACDVADRAAVESLIGEVTADGEPIRSVFHAAGVAIDAPVADLDDDALAASLAAKSTGAAHLDELLTGLDAFVLFSSVAAAWGSGGQAAYAAANAYLDGLAARRHARGDAATSVAWGPWAETGMATGEGVARRLAERGLNLIAPEQALAVLGSAIADGVSGIVAADVNWERFAPMFTISRPSPLIDGLVEKPEPGAETPAEDSELAAELSGRTEGERRRYVLDLVRRQAAAVLGHAGPDAVRPDSAFQSLGFDSLTAVEFRNALTGRTGLDLPVSLVFDHPTPAVLTDHLLAEITSAAPVAAVSSAGPVSDDPIVIVGMSCRFPGGIDSPERLWDLVSAGGDAIGGFPEDRGWDTGRIYNPDPEASGTSTTREGGFVYDAAEFDAPFFGISPREALATDPQQRLVLETVWETFERAGIAPSTLRGSDTAVFVGAGASGYGSGVTEVPEGAEGYLMTGGAGSVLSGRVAYTLGLEGPAVTVDTACSSSLVALHLACRALSTGETSLALAGGVTVMATPGAFIEFSRQRGLSADGRCKSFAAQADGTGWAEGAGMLLLERMSDARANGHPVLAVVRGSAINQDGASNGLTAPSGTAQQRVIRQALANAGLGTSDVDVVEAHGTGTTLGDPIEAQALLATYGQDRDDHPLWLGSVKSNLGHTQAAAGAAGIIKMVYAMRHGVLPRTLHVDAPTPHVDWTSGTIRLLEETTPWDGEGPRRAAVSAFGVSGTNAHVIIEGVAEEAAPAEETGPHGPVLVPVSGRTADALRANAARLADLAGERTDLSPATLASALAAGRNSFENRAVVRAADRDELLAGLRAVADGVKAPGVVTGTADGTRTVAFVFSGQGAQRAGMGRELYAAHPVFADAFDEVCARLDRHLDRPLKDVVFDGGDLLDQTQYTQAGLFAVEVALVRLLDSWGIRPDFVGGHSIGELTAAHVAGVLDLDDAAAGRRARPADAGAARRAARWSRCRPTRTRSCRCSRTSRTRSPSPRSTARAPWCCPAPRRPSSPSPRRSRRWAARPSGCGSATPSTPR